MCASELSARLVFTEAWVGWADESGLRVCFLFGYFFFAHTKKKYLGRPDQPGLNREFSLPEAGHFPICTDLRLKIAEFHLN